MIDENIADSLYKKDVARSRAFYEQTPEWGYTIFPDNDFTETIHFNISGDQVRSFKSQVPVPKDSIALTLIGCADYGLAFGTERRQTGFILGIRRIGPVHGIGPAYGDTPIEQLRLVRPAFGPDFIAD